MEFIFGIDISKDTSNVAILIDGQPIKEFKITNDKEGFNTLGDQLGSFTDPLIIFEATGVYSRRLEAFLKTADYPYTRINPLQAKKDMDSFRHNKTDALDAVGLAKAMALHHYKPTYQEAPVYSELHDQGRTYQTFNEDIVREKNRLHRALQLTFPEIEHLLSTTDGKLYWHLVARFPEPSAVLKYSVSELADIILGATAKRMSADRALSLANRLMDLAQQSFPAVSPNAHAVWETKYRAEEVERLDGLKAQMISEMATKAEPLSETHILTSIPGSAIKTAVCFIAEFGDIRRFHSANAINAFIGIDLIHYESGNYTAGDHIRKRGSAYGRKILFKMILNIIAASRPHPTNISLFYAKKKQSSQPHQTKKIVIASMHRLIRTIFHLVKQNELYDRSLFSAEQ